MRILYVTPSYPPKIGGGERYAQAIAEAAVAAGHDVTVVTSDVTENPEFWTWHPQRRAAFPSVNSENGLTVIRYPAVGMPGGWTALTLWRKAMVVLGSFGSWTEPLLLRMCRRIPSIPRLEELLPSEGPFDVVHAYNLSWEYPLIVASRFAQERQIPFVVTPFAHLGVEVSARVTRNITMPHQLRALRQADAVLALPSAEAEGLISLGLDPVRVHAVGSGYDYPTEVTGAQDVVADIEGLVVVFIGRVSRDKGAITAVNAIQTLREQTQIQVSLVLIGPIDSGFARYYEHLAANKRKGVVLLGPVDEATKHAILEGSAMLVLPSRVDSFGMVLLEAWAHGKPVIGARAGGIPGVIDDGVDGLLVPWDDASALADAIKTLLTDPLLAEEMGKRGQSKTADRYTWTAVWRGVEGVYKEVISQHRSLA